MPPSPREDSRPAASPFVLRSSKDERLAQGRPRHAPFVLSLPKDERPVACLLAAIVALVLLAATGAPVAQRAAGGPSAPARVEASVPFRAGERLTYDVSWSSFLTAGYATLTVSDRKPAAGSVAYDLVGEARSTSLVAALYPLYYKAESSLDAYTLLPQRASLYSQEKRATKTQLTMFDARASRARFEVRTATTTAKDMTIPAGTQDPLSAIFWLRSYPLRTGDRMVVPVIFNGNVLTVQVTVGKKERVATPAGTFTAWRITPVVLDQGKSSVRAMVLWISDDARRLPLKMEVSVALGSFDLALRARSGT